MELVMELVLYAWLIHVLFILSRFLNSFKKNGSVLEKQPTLVLYGRSLFIIVTCNILVMMITNSVFSALTPYLWYGEVFSKDGILQLYGISTTLFYLANTFFACLMLYVLYYFGLELPGDNEQSGSEN